MISEDTLECPSCGVNYLHHVAVEVWERKEDKDMGLHVKVGDCEMSVDNNLKGNPSSRRHGLSITFMCEGCHKHHILDVVQHKGQTFINFKPNLEKKYLK